MLNKERAGDIFDRVRKYSTADEVEVLFYGGKSALTRFANNTIHQNAAEENYGVSVRTAFDGRTARATTNKFDNESLKRVVQASEALAKVQQPDSDLLPMPNAGEGARATQSLPSRHFEQTAAVTPEQRAHSVSKIVSIATNHKLTAAGIFSSSESVEGIFNSHGLSDWHTQTSSEISITMLAADSSGWQKTNSPDVANLNAQALAETAAKKGLESAHPREIPAGKYTVILEPAAVLDLVGFMFWDWGGQAVLDQRSFLTNRVGAKLFGENITIWDDAYHALQSGPAFDGEGVRRRALPLVQAGEVRNLVYARGSAAKMHSSEHAAGVGQIAATGHGLPLPNEMGEIPLNIVFAAAGPGASRTVEQM